MKKIILLSLLLSSAAVVGCNDKPDIDKSVAIIRQKDSIIAWYQMQRTVDSIIISVNARIIVENAMKPK